MAKNLVYDIHEKPHFSKLIVFAIQQLLAIMAATIAVPAIGDRRIRPADVQTMLVAYAARLEERCRKAPYSFFRFGNEKTTINPPEKL